MAIEIILPSMSAGMEDAVISRWLVQPGDTVSKGQTLAEVETDKATMDLESEADGVIEQLCVADGKRADVGQVVAVILAVGEAAPAPVVGVQPTPIAPEAVCNERKHSASPVARRIASAAGLDLTGLAGSGPKGRIVKIDVERLLATVPPIAPQITPPPKPAEINPLPVGIGPHEAKPLSNMRRVIARRLAEAKQTVPHFYLSVDCEMDALVGLRSEINAAREKVDRISVNDFIIKAAARALRKVPEANVIWNGEEILQLADVDIAVAVATDGGLMTPIIRGADRMSLGTLSTEMKNLAALARDGRLKPEQYQGGGFSISNLGMYGVKTFSAIINPPQSCILAVGAVDRRPIGRDNQIVLADVMSVTLSVDHRSVDGALGAQVIAAFKEGIEAPMSLLL